MSTAPILAARSAAPASGGTGRGTRWHRLRSAMRRRVGRIEMMILVVTVLLPQLIIVLLGDG